MILHVITRICLLIAVTTYCMQAQQQVLQPPPIPAKPPFVKPALPKPPLPAPPGAAAPIPKTAAPAAQQAEPEKSPEEIGTHGNWMKKREWLLKSNEVNTKIQKAAADSEELQKKFMTQYKEIDDILDEFYSSQGLEQGKIQELFESINRFLEKKKKKEMTTLETEADDPQLQSKIEVIEAKINSYKQQLEQLRLDMKSIEDLDRSLTDRLKRLDEHLEKIDQEAENAEKIADDLWYVIDDNKAREKYYELKNTILEKVNNSKTYLEDDLLSDFESVIETINKQITRVKDELDIIESKGFIIKDRARRIEKLKLKELQEIDKAKKEQEEQEKIAQKKVVKKKKVVIRPWYTKIYDTFISLLSSGYQGGVWVKDTLLGFAGFGSKQHENKRKA